MKSGIVQGMIVPDAKKDSEYYVSDKSESFSAQARILLGDSEITATQVDIEKYE